MAGEPFTSLSNGARFFRADLHLHSFGASHDVKDGAATPDAIVKSAADEGIAIVALTDHNEVANVPAALAAGTTHNVFVVPGVELSTPEGHLLCYAPTYDALERFFNRLDIADRRTDACRCQNGMLQCLNLLAQEGGFGVIAHIELAGAFEGNMPRFTPAKLDILCHPALEGIEVTRADCPILYTDQDVDPDHRAAAAQRIQRLALGSSQHLARVLNSDAHTLNAVGRNANRDQRVTRYKMEVPSFEGLRLALRTADTRVRIEEELPAVVPTVEGVEFQGAFLDGQAIRFSPNLTCIIGGRGSGKSTAFESVCLVGGTPADEVTVIDSDVWPDLLSLFYRDETGQTHTLARSKGGFIENLDDPATGSISFPLESYRQGATNEISKRVQDDPLALLTFLDRLMTIEAAIDREDDIRKQLGELSLKIADAAANVARIPDRERELTLKSSQLQRLKEDKGEEIIKLQQQLEGEKRVRLAIERSLAKLAGAITSDGITAITTEIHNAIGDEVIEVGAPEAGAIEADTTAYEVSVGGSTETLRKLTSDYVAGVRAQVATWKGKEAQTAGQIESKKQELLKHGIRLDMPFIQKLVSDEARARENVRNLKTWVPVLERLRRDYAGLLRQRWSARGEVASIRTAFAMRASSALKTTLSDLFVSLKFDANALAPEAERLLIDAMGWRTLQQLKARALINQLTLPVLLDSARRKDATPLLKMRTDTNNAVFTRGEVDVLFERIADPELLSQLEAVAVHDRPRLSVTKRVDVAGRAPQYVPRDFKRLSLGQQQSVLLALMLTSESRAPLIVDQPEDNLDSEFIYKTLVPVIRAAKERRQVIVVTHNANIAVLGDAELIVALKATHDKGSIVTRGSIDHPSTCEMACAILEGSREAFDRRAQVMVQADARQVEAAHHPIAVRPRRDLVGVLGPGRDPLHDGMDDDFAKPHEHDAARMAEKIGQHQLMDALRSLAGFDDNPFLRMQAFNLGIVDGALNDLEQFVMRHQFDDERPIEQIALLGALSQMWIFAAYELVRTWRQRCAEVIKLAEAGGLEMKAASLAQDRGYRHYDRELRAEQLRQAREQPELVEQMRRDLDRTGMGFTTLEFIRVALAKREVSAKGRRRPIAFAPGMARIDHETGSMQYELSRGGAIIAYETRRGLADTLRGFVDAPLPSAEDLASFRDYMNPPEP